MDVFVFVLCIIAITTLGGLIREKIKNDAKRASHNNDDSVEQRFLQMEERIQTLERIVTDQKSQLREKIDSLK